MKTNFEHYAKNILEYIDESCCDNIKCNKEDCPVYNICRLFVRHAESLTDEFIEWCKEEYKEPIQMTLFEKSILECAVNHGYEYIARDDRRNWLCIYKEKPKKGDSEWYSTDEECAIDLFDDIFQFIKWENEEPLHIPTTLKELVEKATPKKVDIIGDYNCICTNCENALGKETLEFGLSKMYRWARAYCPYCGQALDWSEDDENG